MASADSIDRLLMVAARLLDKVAGEIRDARLEPVREHIHRVGVALAEIFEIQHAIYAANPELKPKFLDQESPHAASNKLLTQYLSNAVRMEHAGNLGAAVAELEAYLAVETSDFHRAIAVGELERIRNAGRA